MTTSIRPGRYGTAICEGIDARRDRGFKVLYIVRATVPEHPKPVDIPPVVCRGTES